MSSLPESFGQLKRLSLLYLSYNQFEVFPESFSQLTNMNSLYINNNTLQFLPDVSNFSRLRLLKLSNNNIKSFPTILGQLSKNNPDLTIDYRGNPFVEKALLRSERFTKIWQDVPYHLRELLKIYFTGFSTYYFEKTGEVLDFNVFNDVNGLSFDFSPVSENNPTIIEQTLNEYFELLKSKLAEGASLGVILPNTTSDQATMFAQIQAIAFAQNATNIRSKIQGYASNHDVYVSMSGALNDMESAFHNIISRNIQLQQNVNQEKLEKTQLGGRVIAMQDELEHRRIEAHAHATNPINIQVNNYILNNQIGDDFEKLIRLLYPILDKFQQDRATDLQSEIDQTVQKQTVSLEERKNLSTRLKRFLDGVNETISSGKKVIDNVSEASKYWDKLKEFSEGVLQNPNLVETINTLKENFEAMGS